MLSYREQRPPAALSRWIECTWSIHTRFAIPAYRVAPDGCVDILYDAQRGLRAVGAMTAEQSIDLPANTWQGGIRFHPGMARSFLRLHLPGLTDGIAPFDGKLTDEMRNAPCVEAAMDLLVTALRPAAQPVTPVQRALEAITAAHGSLSIEYCARQANLSLRQFRRRCEEESGLSPKLLARILRFRYACRLARSACGRPDWARIAAEAAYFDQAHLIRDFKEFSNCTPMAVFSNTRSRESTILEA